MVHSIWLLPYNTVSLLKISTCSILAAVSVSSSGCSFFLLQSSSCSSIGCISFEARAVSELGRRWGGFAAFCGSCGPSVGWERLIQQVKPCHVDEPEPLLPYFHQQYVHPCYPVTAVGINSAGQLFIMIHNFCAWWQQRAAFLIKRNFLFFLIISYIFSSMLYIILLCTCLPPTFIYCNHIPQASSRFLYV